MLFIRTYKNKNLTTHDKQCFDGELPNGQVRKMPGTDYHHDPSTFLSFGRQVKWMSSIPGTPPHALQSSTKKME